MSQHDLDIADGTGPAFRADLNNALKALGSTSSGTAAPPAPQTGMMWVDTDTPSATRWTLKFYDGTDWIELGQVDTTNNRFIAPTFTDQAFRGISTAGLPNPGWVLDATGNFQLGIAAQPDGFNFISFIRAGIGIGSVAQTGSGTGVLYNTSSDRRLKQDIAPLSGSLDRLRDLKPCTFAWVGRPEAGRTEGFIADEVQEVIPGAVTGQKDETDEGGNPKYQAMDFGRIVPVAIGALQELLAKVEALEARVAALEA